MTANLGEGLDTPDPDESYDVPADTFSARLVLARHHAGGMSIEQAARACGLNPGNWAHWENGRRPRDAFDVAQAISDGLRIDRQWLMFGGALTTVKGRSAKEPKQVTERYPNLTHQSRIGEMRGGSLGPKGRTDPRSPSSTPRRAALVR